MLAVASCSAAEPGVSNAPAPPVAQTVAEPALPSAVAELVSQLKPSEGSRAAAIDGMCNNGPKAVDLESTAAFDRRSGQWVVVDVEHDLGEPPRVVWAGLVPVSEKAAAPARKSIDDAAAKRFCDALGKDVELAETPSLVEQSAYINYATGAANALVRFDSWLLYADTKDGDDTLHLFRTDGRDHTVAARTNAVVGALENGGAEMRAYRSIGSVRRAPDGRSLLVQGWVGPADHASGGAFHWVVPLAKGQ
ncbi:MAG: hypothetical protein HOW73_25500 [Polyangiaceae bacterium]|nr:hypothetical protein [Polyangiaceae bacterium]